MIDDSRQEQAALHVLGALAPDEAREFQAAMRANPELKEFVAELIVATGALAGMAKQTEPPPQLREKILAQIAPEQKVVTLPGRTSIFPAWLSWSFATATAVASVLLFAQDSRLRQTLAAQGQTIRDLNELAGSLQSVTNNLQATVLALQETNRLANLRIAMLNSLLSDDPKAIAVSLWDNSKQTGVFVVQNLKPLPADRDYQLWVLDNGTTPVDAGVFRVDENGNVRLDFKARLPIKIAGKFAVTEEARGGVASPTLKNMVLLGG
jgi:anti-sigma-K factor RskA